MKLADYTLTFGGAGQQPIHVQGQFVRIREASGDVYLQIDGASELKRKAGEAINLGAGNDSRRVMVRSIIAQTVEITTSSEKQSDDRATINATISTTLAGSNTINNPGDITASALVSAAIAANANRKVVKFSLPSTATNPVRLGNATVTAASGDILEPGSSVSYGDESAWYVIRTAAPDETVTVLELERP
jgi:hypothetical protein